PEVPPSPWHNCSWHFRRRDPALFVTTSSPPAVDPSPPRRFRTESEPALPPGPSRGHEQDSRERPQGRAVYTRSALIRAEFPAWRGPAAAHLRAFCALRAIDSVAHRLAQGVPDSPVKRSQGTRVRDLATPQ